MTLIVLFNLKPGIAVEDYEKWAREVDLPGVRAIASVTEYRVRRVTGLFGSDEAAPYQYVEQIELSSMDGFLADIGDPAVQAIVAQFGDMADDPKFMITQDL